MFLAVTGLLTAATAAAHDAVLETSPTAGATLTAAPDRITITTSQPPKPVGLQVTVTGRQGPVSNELAGVSGSTVTQAINDSGPGTYRVLYRITSSDGHLISGELTFTVTAGASSPAPTPEVIAGNTPADPPAIASATRVSRRR